MVTQAGGTSVFTVGHSTHTLDRFLRLLLPLRVDTVVDVRSAPFSRMAPEFNRAHLEKALPKTGLGYVFMGDTLGGRPKDPSQYDEDGRALYYLMAQEPDFNRAIDVLIDRSASHRMALMCSEGRPEHCHRYLLVTRVLHRRGVNVRHVDPAGNVIVLQPSVSESLLPVTEDTSWRSVRSVLQAEPPKAFSKP